MIDGNGRSVIESGSRSNGCQWLRLGIQWVLIVMAVVVGDSGGRFSSSGCSVMKMVIGIC